MMKKMNNDTIYRQAAIDAADSETVSTNPEHFKSSEKFIEFMDDTDIASFGKWQWANGFNTALVATTVQLKNLPSAERRGRWEHYEHREPQYDIEGYKTWAEAYKCSNCGFIHTVIEDFGHYAFCPNCGALMEVE